MKISLPHPLALLAGCVALAAILSWIIPAGQYDRRQDPATGREVVVAGTYHHVQPNPVGPFQMMLAVPHGCIDAASVIFFVFLVGGVHGRGAHRGAHTGRRSARLEFGRSRRAHHSDRVDRVCGGWRAREHGRRDHRARAGAAAGDPTARI